MTRLVKDAFTMELVDVMDVLSWDTLVARLVKDAFTDVFSWDTLLFNVTKDVVRVVKDAFTDELSCVICVARVVKVFTDALS